jgi:outer membrane protein
MRLLSTASFLVLLTTAPLIGEVHAQSGTEQLPSASTPSSAGISHTLSLSDAIHAAVERNYGTRTAANEVRRSDIETRRANDALLPAASASASYGYNYSLVPLSDRTLNIRDSLTGPTREIIEPAGSHSLRYSVGASFNIYRGGADAARIRAANSSLDAARNTASWSRQQIAYDVTAAYVNALRTNELVRASTQTLAESRAQLDRVKGLFDVGTVPVGQVYQQEAVVGQNELSLIQNQNAFENAKADVLFLLNVPPNEYQTYTLSVEGLDTSVSNATVQAEDLSAARIDQVINSRPDISAARAQIAAQQEQIAITRAALYPSLDATASIGGGGSNADLTRVHTTNDLNFGLNLSVPIFDRNQNRLLIEEQEIDIESQRIRLEQDVQQIRSDVAKASNNLASSREALDASARGLKSAEESLRLATERLRVGAGTQIDVIVAQAQVETARTNRVNAKFNYVLAQRQLQYTLGQWSY